MLYVCDIKSNDISVIDTKDAVVEIVSREVVYDYFNRGVSIAGVSSNSIHICSGKELENEFFRYCVNDVNNIFSHKSFNNDSDIFKYLVSSFKSCYRGVANLQITPVISIDINTFTVNCISEVCRLHSLQCDIIKDSIQSNQVYKDSDITVYAYRAQNNMKAFKIKLGD